MNFREFVQSAEEHLLRMGWVRDSHNGVWPMFVKGARCALPEALSHELWASVEFAPTVEKYLVDSGWRRASGGTMVGQLLFVSGDTYKNLRMALIEQLKRHRLDRAEVAPRPTPQDMKQLLNVTHLRGNSGIR